MSFYKKIKNYFKKYYLIDTIYRFAIGFFHIPKLANLSLKERILIHLKILKITSLVQRSFMPHNDKQIYLFINHFLSLPQSTEGCIVEAGCFKGISAAKFSIAAKKVNRKIILFDSFEGLPENYEEHKKSIFGHSIEGWFEKGEYHGTLEEVKRNIDKYGYIDMCNFIPGWFEDTMPKFNEKICAAYIDVDLASSTKTCLKYLYPLLVPGGVLISQDGDFPLVIEAFDDDVFWEQEIGCKKPTIYGLGKNKMLKIIKPTK